MVRGIQGSEVHFDFVGAAGTEKPPAVFACFPIDCHRILGEYRASVKEGAMMLAAPSSKRLAEAKLSSATGKSAAAPDPKRTRAPCWMDLPIEDSR